MEDWEEEEDATAYEIDEVFGNFEPGSYTIVIPGESIFRLEVFDLPESSDSKVIFPIT